MNRIIKIFLALGIIIAVFLEIYYVKCQANICFFQDFHLEKYLPLQAFQFKEIIRIRKDTGRVFADDFRRSHFFPIWAGLWMQEKGDVTVKYDLHGIGGTRCLFIENSGEKGWSYPQIHLVNVRPSDIFAYTGYIKTGGQAVVSFGITTYNKDKCVIDWDYAAKDISGTQEWSRISNRFLIPARVFYIRFNLSGHGKGKAWFDNIEFRKEGHE